MSHRQAKSEALARRRAFAAALILLAGLLSALLTWPSAGADELKEPLSVYEVKPVRDGIILGATALLDLFPILNGYNFVYVKPRVDPDELIPWDRSAIGNRNVFQDTLSDVIVATAVAAPVLVDYIDVGWNRVYFEDMIVYAQTLAINTAITSLFKYTVQRPLPRVYAGDPEVVGSHRGYEDFYSGHVSTVTCALSAFSLTLDLRHDSGIWPWIVTGVVGTAVATERVAGGEHFPTAVLAGAVMGPAVGILVPWLHKRQVQGGTQFGLEPATDGAQLTLTRRL